MGSAARLAGRILTRNGLRAAGRSAFPDEPRERFASAIALLSALAFAAFLAWGAALVLALSRTALAQLPELDPRLLLVHVLRALFSAAAFLLLLGALTSSVSLLFLSDELPALLPLPIPHRSVFRRLFLRSIGAASVPTWFLFLPLVGVAAWHASSPLLVAATLALALGSVVLVAGGAGASAALLLVRLVPPRRARLLAGTLSALGLAGALLGLRGARPERLFDPAEALEILRRLGTAPPSPPGWSFPGWAAESVRLAFDGSPRGLLLAAALAAGAFLAVALVAAPLAPVHLATWRRAREASAPAAPADGRRTAGSLFGELLRAEIRSFLRDASTPAQLGSLAAVFVLDLLNLRLLPTPDGSARDLVGGLQTGLALFLVSALSLRFAYPAVSSDGRAALLLKSFPLSPVRHLAARYVVRAVPSIIVTLVLVGVSGSVLGLEPRSVAISLAAGLAGAAAIPALHLGFGALFPRYGAPNAVAAALGPGGLFALAISTVLSLAATPVVSSELRSLVAVVSGTRFDEGLLLTAWCAITLASGAVPMLLAARALGQRDISLA